MISRDRAGAYAKGARNGAPEAVQIADRFHLLQNLAERLEVVFAAHARHLRTVGQAGGVSMTAESATLPVPSAEPQTKTRVLAADRREQRVATHRQIWTLHRQGWSGQAIAHYLGVGRATVFRYLRHEDLPELQGRRDAGRSLLDRWRRVVLDHWNSGRRNARWLFRMLQQQHNYRGSYATLTRYLQRLRAAQGDGATHSSARRSRGVLTAAPQPVPTPRAAAWLVLRQAENRRVQDQALLADLRQHAPELDEAVALAERFIGLVRDHAPDRLDPWLQRTADSTVEQLRRFAKHISTDYDAVRAAVGSSWSNGQVEGQINRLKTIKRQMYGRAGLDLLRRQFLIAA